MTSIDTRLIHSGEPVPRVEGAVCLPVFQSAIFEYGGEQGYDNLKYIRLNNTPNHRAVQEKLAAVAGGEDALVTASGMSAISTTLLTFLKAGDHALFQDCLYGGTHTFVTGDLPGCGIRHDFVSGNDPESWERHLTPDTKLIYMETMTNPMLEVPDLEAVAAFAQKHGILAVVDSTFASPVNYRPLEHGFDLSLHSCTKYLNGHSDIVAGCVIGSRSHVQRVVHTANHLGGCIDPHACFLLHRGMKTLALRVRHQNAATLALATFLNARSEVEQVNYPGLESHPQHERAARLFGGCGGVLSFELSGDFDRADALIRSLNLPISAPSLGGVETLITRPVTTSHSGMLPGAREKAGIADRLIRVAVGIESADDLCDDFGQALDGV